MNAIERYRATYEFRPVDHLFRQEFFVWPETWDRWIAEGADQKSFQQVALFDEPARLDFWLLGWCEPPCVPAIEEKVLEEQGQYQIVRDRAGRTVKRFTGHQKDFMPTFLKHAVTNDADWERDILPAAPGMPRHVAPERVQGNRDLLPRAQVGRDG